MILLSTFAIFFFKGTNLLGSTQGTKADLEEVIHWTDKGKIKPLISTVLPFSEMVQGHVMMAKAEQIGKILTTPHSSRLNSSECSERYCLFQGTTRGS